MTTYTNRVYSVLAGDRSTGMPFSRGENVHQIDSGLYSVQGAHAIISDIASRRVVKKLILGHNELGNSGCITLFQFLSSETGQRYEINEISLNSNRIGDSGLNAIATYLHGNKVLRELFLQNNDFTGNPNTARALADAVNASHLKVLSLTSNQQMSDSFIEAFLQTLMSAHLRELYISTTNITPRSLPYIVDYLSSGRCKLSDLQCNGNLLGLRAVQSVIRAVEQHNYSLTSLELYSNRLMDVDSSIEEDVNLHDRSMMDVWKDCNSTIRQILVRNDQLGRETQRQALDLLLYARTFLLRTRGNAVGRKRTGSRSDNAVVTQKSSSFPFLELPLEIQFHLLSFLSPIVSVKQCAEIYRYAATPTTLPSLLPRLVGSTTDWKEASQKGGTPVNGRNSGRYDSSRAREKYQWLDGVECMVYEPSE